MMCLSRRLPTFISSLPLLFLQDLEERNLSCLPREEQEEVLSILSLVRPTQRLKYKEPEDVDDGEEAMEVVASINHTQSITTKKLNKHQKRRCDEVIYQTSRGFNRRQHLREDNTRDPLETTMCSYICVYQFTSLSREDLSAPFFFHQTYLLIDLRVKKD
jgi:hypothetical protein